MQIKSYRHYVQFFLLIFFPLLTFIQTLDHTFVWDDDIHIIHNEYDKPEKPQNIIKYWSPNPKLIYAPLTYTIWGLVKNDYTGKLNPLPFHLINIVTHILSVCLIFLILKRMDISSWASFAGAMLFAVHPLQVEAVAWATGLRSLLSGLLGFAAIWTYLLFREKNSNKLLYTCSLFLFFLSICAKPSAIILPAFLFLFDYFHYKINFKSIFITLIPYILVTLVFTWILMHTNTQPRYVPPILHRPLVMADTINFNLYKIIIPLKLCSYYGRTPYYIMQSKWFYLSWIILPVLFWSIIKIKNKYPVLILALLLFIIGILPLSGLIPFEAQNWNTPADRYLYLSMLGVALSFAYIIHKWQRKRVIWILAVSILTFWFLRSLLVQVPQWKNDSSIWNSAISYFPEHSIPYSKRAEIYLDQGKLDLAMHDYQQAIKRNPNFAKGYNNIGLIYSQRGEWNNALIAYLRAIQLDGSLTRTYKNIGMIYFIQGEFDKAEQALKNAIKIDPGYADAYYRLAQVFTSQKKYNESERALKQTIRLDRNHLRAYIALANLYTDNHQAKKALEMWQMILILDPENRQAQNFFLHYQQQKDK